MAQEERNVTISRLGADKTEVKVEAGTTLQQLLQQAGVQVNNREEIRINNQRAELNAVVNPGDKVMLVPAIRGGFGKPRLTIHCIG